MWIVSWSWKAIEMHQEIGSWKAIGRLKMTEIQKAIER